MKNKPDSTFEAIDAYFRAIDIHELRRESEGGIVTGVVALIVLLLESLILYFVLAQGMAVIVGLLLHALVVAGLILYARVLLRNRKEGRFAYLLLLTTIVCGPYGAAGVVLAIVSHLAFSRTAQPFDQWHQTMFPYTLHSVSENTYSDMMIGRDESSRDYSVIPFRDVIAFGTETQKRHALAKMTSNFSPTFATAFKKALGDSSNSIRVQAATAITKIEHQFTDRLMKLSALRARHPNDPVVVLALAAHYDAYAYTGLLDSDRELANRTKALEYYGQYLKLRPDDVDVRTRIGRIFMRNKDYVKAANWFRDCISHGYASSSISQWYSEALFSAGRYEELRRHTASVPPVSDEDAVFQPHLKEAVQLWSAMGGRA